MEKYLETPLWDCKRTEEERLRYLLAELTIEEKLQCMGTGCPAIPRLGISEFYLGGEGAHGVQARNDQGKHKREADLTTIFPNPIGMCATWDTELIKQAGRVTGMEARGLFSTGRFGALSLWAPTVDMERDPRWGRTEEGYGEDPVLAGEMAGAYIEGMQGDDPDRLLAAATVKHFYANNMEEGRCWTSSAIDARNREEYYLEPFRRTIQEHGAEGLMTAYNEINELPCMLNPEVRSIAKEQWGLRHVVCDGGDVSQTVEFHHYFSEHADTIAAGLKAGIDCFTDDEDLVRQAATDAWERGMISEEQMDEALYHHFAVMLHLGLFDPPGRNPYEEIGVEVVGCAEHQRIARQVAAEAVVLLKNEEHLLPIAEGKSLVAIGPLADVWYKDWYSGIPPYHVTPLQGLRDAFGERITATESGIERVRIRVVEGDADESAGSYLAADPDTANASKSYLAVNPEDNTIHKVAQQDAETFEVEYWGDGKITLRACSTGKLLTTEDDAGIGQEGLITASSEEAFGWFVREIYYASLDGKPYEGAEGQPGREGQQGKAEEQSDRAEGQHDKAEEQNDRVLEWKSWNKSPVFFDSRGKLCVSIETAEEVPKEGVAGYQAEKVLKEGIADCQAEARPDDTGKIRENRLRFCFEQAQDGIRQAAQAAEKADIAVLYLGANPMITCKEEIDRTHLELPAYQQKLMEAVYAANPNTVLVLVSSVPFAIRWAKEHIPAIINTAAGGMELGNGIADVLTGNMSPAARLPLTWYRSAEDLPPIEDYDIIQGGRTYQYFEGEVLYPFGHGLSYAGFTYEDLAVEISEREGEISESQELSLHMSDLSERKRMNISLHICNVSERTSDEVVQVYGRKIGSAVKRPLKTLLAFQRERQIKGGENRKVTMAVPLDALRYYSEEQGCKVWESGEYEIMVGASSEEILLRKKIVLS